VTDRQTRRKERTRRALIDAALRSLAQGADQEPSILSLTEAADVGFGTFYNHFRSKTELFDTAVADVVERYGRLLDAITQPIQDPAEVFTVAVRLTGRMIATRPEWMRVISRIGTSLTTADTGLAPRALRDINNAVAAGRFHVQDPTAAIIGAGGTILALLHLGVEHPALVDEKLCDAVAEQLLRMFGMTPDEARDVVTRPLPPIPQIHSAEDLPKP
jgi:AcrR family transcriptional regulator